MQNSVSAPERSRAKGDKRERTRSKLLEAARSLIREKGYEQTTLENIAERAGMTTGAIYGNFKNRDDLFIALGQTYWAPIVPRVKPGSNFAEVMRSVAEATIAALPDRATAAVGRLSGLAYTLTHEEMRAQVTELTAHSYSIGEQWLGAVVKESDLPIPMDQLVRVLHALTEGLVFQRLLTPELITDDVIAGAFGVFAKKVRKL